MSEALCQFTGLGVRFDDVPLFSNLNHSLMPGLTGLVAPNGRGKSVLLHLLTGQLTPSDGAIQWRVPVVHLGQIERLGGPRLADALGVAELWDAFARIESGQGTPEDLDRVADLWHRPAEWARLLTSAGIERTLDDPVDTLSGGEQTRLALCRVLLRPDACLLLDEPTNHLDAAGRNWLMEHLARHAGGALVASHDRALLRRMDRIWELTPDGLEEYGGGYDLYRSVKDARLAALEQRVDHLDATQRKQKQARQAALEKAATRRKQGERERRSGSQGKMLMDARKQRAEGSLATVKHRHQQRVEATSQALSHAKAELEQQQSQRLVLATQGVRGGIRLHLSELVLPYGDPRPISLTIHSGERWRVSGDNGSGKSTLLKVIAGLARPAGGDCRVRGSVVYLDQQLGLLNPDESAYANLKRLHPGTAESDLRTQLASLRLRGDKALLSVAGLSGGERLKVALLAVTGGHNAPDVLLLDEPDNHLDLDSKTLLEQALAGYPGTLMIVSHDADFVTALAPDHELALTRTAECSR
ncbi:ABC-F family ATP-binding cassette domain-containing protein [Saccharospirillum salsuginis]|uniref:ABC transporter ATP-binding protein n=1 Tax=Saccharospirillum salsuginis TaxID=418750 RepID=A0A918NJL5_9GAMM|nr:ABC-F family ATP-binding cassette domain-containing protein [Saccharospirillum salsuginis]GGX72346.1 ABC transporter ATP-binding protein [Saccharospirillum salsuginis]